MKIFDKITETATGDKNSTVIGENCVIEGDLTFEKTIEVELKNAEKEIVELKKSSPEKINKIATETSAQLIKQLIGEEINNSSISAIVEDLSKKNKGKYYGN